MMSTILVTGGSGLVGHAVQEAVVIECKAEEHWIFMSSSDADLMRYDSTCEMFKKYRPTAVLHLAAKVGGLFNNMKHNAEFWHENIRMQENIFAAAKEFGIQKMVSCLSTCIFPDNTVYPINESMIHMGPPHNSNAGYSYAKRMIDVVNHLHYVENAKIFTSVIPTNIFGKHDNFNLEQGHVIPSLIHKCFVAKEEGTPFVVMGSGKPLRQFIYAADLAKLMIWVMRKYNDPDPIILSVDEADEMSIADVANSIAQAMEFTGDIVFDLSQADGQFKKTACNRKLRAHLPEFVFTPFSVAISETVKWFNINYANCRK